LTVPALGRCLFYPLSGTKITRPLSRLACYFQKFEF
jgi:hypothetical protein